MQTANTFATPVSAYAAAPQQAGFAPPAAVDLPAPDEVPREYGESGGEPGPDLFGRPARDRTPEATPAGPALAGAAYGADGQPAAALGAGLQVDLLAA